jgi:hypothetical protein
MRIFGAATSISWIPTEAVTGIVYKVPFGVQMAHYDEPPPDTLPDVDAYLAADQARFANPLHAWVDVRRGQVVDFGHTGAGRMGSTTMRLAGRGLTFAPTALPDLQHAEQLSPTSVRFEQTVGGRTGVPAPRRVRHQPYVQFNAPLAWTTLSLTLHADGRQSCEIKGASPFPRHWLYGRDRALIKKTATIDYHEWSTTAFGRHSPWGDSDSPAMVAEIETALERQLSVQITRVGQKPQLRRLERSAVLTRQDDAADDLYVLLDGVLRVEVDGLSVAELGPGAVIGERAIVESGLRTATLSAVTPCLVAVADRDSVDPADRRMRARCHRRERNRRN